MTHKQICKSYSFETLEGVIRSLEKSRSWNDRLKAAKHELEIRIKELKS